MCDSQSDVLMKVFTTAKLCFRVVQVHAREVLIADNFSELSHRLGVGLRGSNVVAGAKEMAGVETDSDAGFVIDQGDDQGELFKCAAEDVRFRVGLSSAR